MRPESLDRFAVPLALFALYIIWGSTYLAIRIAVETFPPFLMGAVRFLIAGVILYLVARARGLPQPSLREWGGAAIVGGLLLAGGNGLVAHGEQTVASGLAAIIITTVPLWTIFFAGLWGAWPSRVEIGGIVLGFGGVALLNAGTSIHAHPLGLITLVFSALCWGLGSAWSRHLPLPRSIMASGAEQLAGGAILVILSVASGEHLGQAPSLASMLAVAYLVVFGSLVAFSAYVFLLGRVRPALATSYAYANPVVAVGLGVVFAGEHVTPLALVALLVVLSGVALVLMNRDRQKQPSAS